MKTFFTADQHFGHESIIGLSLRPFASASEMDSYMIDAHNSVVDRRDRVIHVGDFSHRCEPRRLRAIFGKLNGAHFLVPGNHDDARTLSLGWAGVQPHVWNVKVDGVHICCCHYGLRVWPGQRRGALQLYGHSHGKLPGNEQSCDVGVDAWDFRPVSLQEIRARLERLPRMVDPESCGGFRPAMP
ncbi:metallophosphoesterase [Bradyrhizobium symbiodeficiens]|uniref:metallophosphoesterase n=1 Tax=Bradyrhizobium symbiodeficiens TaxID=1404367 RepID=UPI0015F2E498|nr:metallophosphoesterase [Bradyrhizobium symbiodeficiens]